MFIPVFKIEFLRELEKNSKAIISEFDYELTEHVALLVCFVYIQGVMTLRGKWLTVDMDCFCLHVLCDPKQRMTKTNR